MIRSASMKLSAAAADQLLDWQLRSHDHVIIDLPRRVDAMTAAVMARANQVVLVVQQSVTALRDGTTPRAMAARRSRA